MALGYSQQQPVPDEFLGPLHDATGVINDPPGLRRSFQEHGYVFLRNAFDQREVLAARKSIFHRLAAVGEIADPVEEGIATGGSRRRESTADLGSFWKAVSEDTALRAVTHGTRLRQLVGFLFDAPALPHDYLFLRPAPVGNATNLHYDYPFFAGEATQIVTCWIPLGDIPVSEGPLIVVENSHRFEDLTGPMRTAALGSGPAAFAAIQEVAYQSAATETLEFVRARKTRLLTTTFQPGDVIIFDGFTMHGSLDNCSPRGRVRLSVDVRYQPAAEPSTDPRYFGPNPSGAKGGGYGDQKAAQPLGTPWVAKQ